MAITLYTDTLCTVADADASRYLIQNENWNGLITAEKEKYLKSATKIINRMRFRGSRDSSSQALEFPRTMDYLNYPNNYFDDSYVEDALAEAVSAQVAYDLAPISTVDLKGGEVLREDKVCQAAKDILWQYINHLSPTNIYDYIDEYDPLRGS